MLLLAVHRTLARGGRCQMPNMPREHHIHLDRSRFRRRAHCTAENLRTAAGCRKLCVHERWCAQRARATLWLLPRVSVDWRVARCQQTVAAYVGPRGVSWLVPCRCRLRVRDRSANQRRRCVFAYALAATPSTVGTCLRGAGRLGLPEPKFRFSGCSHDSRRRPMRMRVARCPTAADPT